VAPFPWNTVLHAGLCLLRLNPRDFWAITPVELFAITGGLRPAPTGLDRRELEGLLRRFPDGGSPGE
jgi:uncharacterized phage protein (TIGR02216 family)